MLKAVGFNCFRWPAFGVEANTVPTFDLPPDLHGLMFYAYVFDRADFSENADNRRRDLTTLIETVRDHPAMLCYEQRNEPAYTFRDFARPKVFPEGMVAGSRLIRELDPNHPIRIGHGNCNLTSTLKKYNAAVDVVGCNPYVVNPPHMRIRLGYRNDGLLVDSPDQTLSSVGEHTTKMMRVAEGRPVWMMLQASANEIWFNENFTPENRGLGIYEHHRQYPTRWQMRFMAFNAIIRGATAMEWFLLGLPVDSGAWMEVCQVIGELSALHDVLCSPTKPGTLNLDYRELGFSDWTGVETLVKMHQGRPWILAVNTQFDPVEPTFSNLPDGLGDRLEVVGENRQVSIKNGAFSDRFQPYEVRVYAPT